MLKQQTHFSTVKENHWKRTSIQSTASPNRLNSSTTRPPTPLPHHSPTPTATRRNLTSTSSREEEEEEEVDNSAAVAEIHAAKVARVSTGTRQTPRQLGSSISSSRTTTRKLPSPQGPADFIAALETSLSSASPTVLCLHHSKQNKRETDKGADVSERGDPLLIIQIKIEKQSTLCSRRLYKAEMADRWGRRLVYYSSHPRPKTPRPNFHSIASGKWY